MAPATTWRALVTRVVNGVRRRGREAIGRATRRRAIAALLARPAARRVLHHVPGGRLLYAPGWDRLHPFDRRFGTDTSGTVPIDRLSDSPEVRDHAVFYAGSQPSVIRAALATLPALTGATFLDLGCGKGRALLVASEWPFARVIGVEVSSGLAAIASANAVTVSRREPGRPPIEVRVGDARGCAIPDGDLVVFLYHPFDETVLAAVVANIERAAAAQPTRRLFVIYCNPVAGRCFDASPLFSRRFAAQIPYSSEDLGHGPDVADPVMIWQAGAVPAPAPDPSLDVDIVVEPPRRRAIFRQRPQ